MFQPGQFHGAVVNGVEVRRIRGAAPWESWDGADGQAYGQSYGRLDGFRWLRWCEATKKWIEVFRSTTYRD
jgi:hypothetical protein